MTKTENCLKAILQNQTGLHKVENKYLQIKEYLTVITSRETLSYLLHMLAQLVDIARD